AQMKPLVLEVALHPHRAEDEPAERHAGRGGGELPLDAAGAARVRYYCRVAAPTQADRLPPPVTYGESRALVGGVGPQEGHPRAFRLEVDLNRVLLGVAVEPGLI